MRSGNGVGSQVPPPGSGGQNLLLSAPGWLTDGATTHEGPGQVPGERPVVREIQGSGRPDEDAGHRPERCETRSGSGSHQTQGGLVPGSARLGRSGLREGRRPQRLAVRHVEGAPRERGVPDPRDPPRARQGQQVDDQSGRHPHPRRDSLSRRSGWGGRGSRELLLHRFVRVRPPLGESAKARWHGGSHRERLAPAGREAEAGALLQQRPVGPVAGDRVGRQQN